MQTSVSVRRKWQIRSFAAVCTAMFLCTSCSNEDEPHSNAKSDTPFGFNVSLEDADVTSRSASSGSTIDSYEFGDGHKCEVEVFDCIDAKLNTVVATRGAMITGSANFYDNFAVTAYKIGENQKWSEINPATDAVPYFTDMKVSKTAGGWESSVNQYWPGAGSMLKFFAYAPASMSQISYDDNKPTLTYTVPEVSTDQPDLLEAQAEHPGNYNSPVNLNFSHLLTAVQIKIKADFDVMPRLKKVTFKGIKGSGTYEFGSRQWNVADSEPTSVYYAYTYPYHRISRTRKGPEILVGGKNTFMMIPQELGDNAVLELTFEDYSTKEDRTMTCPISGKVWEQGKTVVYTINLNLYEFYIELYSGAEESGKNEQTNHSPFRSNSWHIAPSGKAQVQDIDMLGWAYEPYSTKKVYEPDTYVEMTVPEGETYTELILFGVWPEELYEKDEEGNYLWVFYQDYDP